MAAVNVKPLGDRVLVQPLEEQEVKKGGIIIPDTAKEKPQEGIRRHRNQNRRSQLPDYARGRHPRHHWITGGDKKTYGS